MTDQPTRCTDRGALPGRPCHVRRGAGGRTSRCGRPRWGLPDVAIAILLALFVPTLVLGSMLAAGVPRDGAVILLGSAMLPWVGFGLWPWITTRLQGNGPTDRPRLTPGRPSTCCGASGAALACIVLGTVVAALVAALRRGVRLRRRRARHAAPTCPAGPSCVFALGALVGAPLFEELCFRGLAFAAFARWAHRRGFPAVPWADRSSRRCCSRSCTSSPCASRCCSSSVSCCPGCARAPVGSEPASSRTPPTTSLARRIGLARGVDGASRGRSSPALLRRARLRRVRRAAQRRRAALRVMRRARTRARTTSSTSYPGPPRPLPLDRP